MACVSAERMRTMAALLRDPNPLHWDRDAVAAIDQLKARGPESARNYAWWGQAGQTVLALGCVAVVANHRVLDAAVIDRLHAAGLRALCYTVNDGEAARRLEAAGIDGVITDAVDRFAPVDAGTAD